MEGHIKSATEMVKCRKRIPAVGLKFLENHSGGVILMVRRNVNLHPKETRVKQTEIWRKQPKRRSLKVVTVTQKELYASMIASLKRVRF